MFVFNIRMAQKCRFLAPSMLSLAFINFVYGYPTLRKKTRLFFSVPKCLSRACLDKMILFVRKWHREKACFAPAIVHLGVRRRDLLWRSVLWDPGVLWLSLRDLRKLRHHPAKTQCDEQSVNQSMLLGAAARGRRQTVRKRQDTDQSRVWVLPVLRTARFSAGAAQTARRSVVAARSQ